MSDMIIALSGKRGVGKTALANYLHRHHGFKVISFAEPLKKIAEQMFPGITKAPKEKHFIPYDWVPREFLISLGELGRYYDPNIWVDRAINSLGTVKGKFVIDDLRFQNEASNLKSRGARIVRINRYEKDNPYGKNLDIPSETDLDKYAFDYIIDDCVNGSLKQLYHEGDIMLKTII